MSTEDKNAEWLKEFKRARFNAVYFVEEIWNKLHPDKAVELSDDEKQAFYKMFRAVPIVDDLVAYTDRLEKLRAQGYKDWEIDA